MARTLRKRSRNSRNEQTGQSFRATKPKYYALSISRLKICRKPQLPANRWRIQKGSASAAKDFSAAAQVPAKVSVAVVGDNGITQQKETKVTKPSIRSSVETFFGSLLSPVQNLRYRVSFIPSGISGGGALMRLWLLP